MIFDVINEKFECEIIDKERYFRLVYSPTLNTYFMLCEVSWIVSYERYYYITQDDYELYKIDKRAFYRKFEKEIGQMKDCLTERFAGSAALRDYDGANGFQNAFPLPEGQVNAFQHYLYIDGVFYARIVWQDGEIFVPPVQALLKNGNFFFPLREKCEYQTNAEGQPICYKLKKEHVSFDEIMSRCFAAFSNTTSNDPYCLKRNEDVVSLLNEMQRAVKAGTYPRDYSVIPLYHYVERNVDADEMYDSIQALDDWYRKNYKNKSEAVLRREQIRKYLISEGGLSERRADMAISKLARHKDIYLEFSEYVAKRLFPENGVVVFGHSAESLHRNYPLSALGAYNYLIYLRENPQEALADLKAGLPRK